MGEEDINTYKKYISNLDITKYIIKDDEDNYWYSDKYVYQLQTQLQQKESIIKEAREYIEDNSKEGPIKCKRYFYSPEQANDILEILDKVD